MLHPGLFTCVDFLKLWQNIRHIKFPIIPSFEPSSVALQPLELFMLQKHSSPALTRPRSREQRPEDLPGLGVVCRRVWGQCLGLASSGFVLVCSLHTQASTCLLTPDSSAIWGKAGKAQVTAQQ